MLKKECLTEILIVTALRKKTQSFNNLHKQLNMYLWRVLLDHKKDNFMICATLKVNKNQIK